VVDTNVGEVWKAIAGVDDVFEASNMGNVRSLKTGKTLHLSTGKLGYVSTCVTVGGEWKKVLVHRMVLLAHIGKPPTDKHQAAHGNGNRADNRLENLRWATQQENELDKVCHGTACGGKRGMSADKKNKAIELLASGLSACNVAKIVGVHYCTIYRLIDRRKAVA